MKGLNMKTLSSFVLLLPFFILPLGIKAKELPHLKIIAHRGASGTLPEHTLEGFSCAYGMGADYLEPDLVMTKDGELIILHDIHLEPTTNVKDLFPEREKNGHFFANDFILEEIKSLSVHERVHAKTGEAVFPGRFPKDVANFKIPTFREFLNLVRGLNKGKAKKIGIYPEMKAPKFHEQHDLDIIEATYGILKEFGYEEKPEEIFLQCFELEALEKVKTNTNTKIPLIYLTEKASRLDLMRVKKTAVGIGCPITDLIKQQKEGWISTKIGSEIKASGLMRHPYTLRKDQLPEGIKSFEELVHILKGVGIEAVFTDFPGLAREVLKK